MKFRDPKTGEVYDNIGIARGRYCAGKHCSANSCNLAQFRWCDKWVKENPVEAARLMGYEVVDNSEKPNIRRICKVLGGENDPLEPGERFTYPGMAGAFYITESGTLVSVDDTGGEEPMMCASTLINGPDRIIRRPGFTDDELPLLRALRSAGVFTLSRSRAGVLSWSGGEYKSGALPEKLFPSLRPGQAVQLGDILGDADEKD